MRELHFKNLTDLLRNIIGSSLVEQCKWICSTSIDVDRGYSPGL